MMVEVAAVGVWLQWLAGLWRALWSLASGAILAVRLAGSERWSRIGATCFLAGCHDSERDRRPPLRARESLRVSGVLAALNGERRVTSSPFGSTLTDLVSRVSECGSVCQSSSPRVAAQCANQPATHNRCLWWYLCYMRCLGLSVCELVVVRWREAVVCWSLALEVSSQ